MTQIERVAPTNTECVDCTDITDKHKYLLACKYIATQLTEKDVNAVIMGNLIVKWRDVLKWIEQELEIENNKAEKNDFVNAISREDALMCLTGKFENRTYEPSELIKIFASRINALSPVTPIRPKGHWIDTNEHHYYNDGDIETTELRCSCCNGTVEWDIELLHKPYYCENCGADMRGE